MKSLSHEYYTYITTNPNRKVLYTGVTNHLARRLVEHYARRGQPKTFAGKFYCYCLVYVEEFQYIDDAIEREKQLKRFTREQKEVLIGKANPEWLFLNKEFCQEWPPRKIWGEYCEALRKESRRRTASRQE